MIQRAEASQRAKWLALETALMRIAAFPRTRTDELSIESAREIARAALAFCKPAEQEEAAECRHCHGKGWNDEIKAVDGHYHEAEVFAIECEHCNGTGVAP